MRNIRKTRCDRKNQALLLISGNVTHTELCQQACIAAKLLLRVVEYEDTAENIFSIVHLLTLVIEEQRNHYDTEFVWHVSVLLDKVKYDIQELDATTKSAFKASLNLIYLHQISFEAGKHKPVMLGACTARVTTPRIS